MEEIPKVHEVDKKTKPKPIVVDKEEIKEIIKSIDDKKIDHLNCIDMVDKFLGKTIMLDTAIKNDLFSAGQNEQEVKRIKNHPSVTVENWSVTDDPWYAVYIEHKNMKDKHRQIISYQAYKIEVMIAVLNKVLDLIGNTKSASEESIRLETMRSNMEGFMNRYDKMVDKQAGFLDTMQKNQMESARSMISEISKSMQKNQMESARSMISEVSKSMAQNLSSVANALIHKDKATDNGKGFKKTEPPKLEPKLEEKPKENEKPTDKSTETETTSDISDADQEMINKGKIAGLVGKQLDLFIARKKNPEMLHKDLSELLGIHRPNISTMIMKINKKLSDSNMENI